MKIAIIYLYGLVNLFNYSKKGATLKTNSAPKRLLVIDDDPTVLFAVRKLLLHKNVEIDTSESLEEAKKLIDTNNYQLIITDLGFSDQIDNAGIFICCYARKRTPDVAIILWTARDISEITEQINQAGFDLCLSKPIAPNVICRVVENIGVHNHCTAGKAMITNYQSY